MRNMTKAENNYLLRAGTFITRLLSSSLSSRAGKSRCSYEDSSASALTWLHCWEMNDTGTDLVETNLLLRLTTCSERLSEGPKASNSCLISRCETTRVSLLPTAKRQRKRQTQTEDAERLIYKTYRKLIIYHK